jgi:hypothetical protein
VNDSVLRRLPCTKAETNLAAIALVHRGEAGVLALQHNAAHINKLDIWINHLLPPAVQLQAAPPIPMAPLSSWEDAADEASSRGTTAIQDDANEDSYTPLCQAVRLKEVYINWNCAPLQCWGLQRLLLSSVCGELSVLDFTGLRLAGGRQPGHLLKAIKQCTMLQLLSLAATNIVKCVDAHLGAYIGFDSLPLLQVCDLRLLQCSQAYAPRTVPAKQSQGGEQAPTLARARSQFGNAEHQQVGRTLRDDFNLEQTLVLLSAAE